jgi:hypothetical protein
MKQYTVNAIPKHRTSLWLDVKIVKENFPVILEGNNKQEVKEIAQTIIRDLGTYPEGFKIDIEPMK